MGRCCKCDVLSHRSPSTQHCRLHGWRMSGPVNNIHAFEQTKGMIWCGVNVEDPRATRLLSHVRSRKTLAQTFPTAV